jgi:branched-chain amino acid transport system substrate-binding protein
VNRTDQQVKKGGALQFMLAGALAAVTACGASSNGPTAGQPILIGVAAVQSGSLSVFGLDLIPAIQLAVNQINAQGGVNGRQFTLKYADTMGTGAGSVAAIQSLLSNKPVALMGTVLTAEELPLVPILNNQAKIPFFGGATTTTLEANVSGGSNWLFRVIPDSTYGIKPQAAYAKDHLDTSRMAVITTTDALGHDTLTQLTAAISSLGLPAPVSTQFTDPNATDYTAAILATKKANPTIVFQQANAPQVAVFLRQSAQLGLNVPKLMGTSAAFATFYNKLADPNLMNGNIANVDSAPDPNSTDPATAAFAAAYHKATGSDPTEIVTMWYAAVFMLAAAIEKAGTTDPTRLAQALAQTKDFTKWHSFTMPGIKFTCDANQNCDHHKILVTGENGVMKQVGTYDDESG